MIHFGLVTKTEGGGPVWRTGHLTLKTDGQLVNNAKNNTTKAVTYFIASEKIDRFRKKNKKKTF